MHAKQANKGEQRHDREPRVRLKEAIRRATNDNARYALGDKVREFSCLNVADFAASRPPIEHMLGLQAMP